MAILRVLVRCVPSGRKSWFSAWGSNHVKPAIRFLPLVPSSKSAGLLLFLALAAVLSIVHVVTTFSTTGLGRIRIIRASSVIPDTVHKKEGGVSSNDLFLADALLRLLARLSPSTTGHGQPPRDLVTVRTQYPSDDTVLGSMYEWISKNGLFGDPSHHTVCISRIETIYHL